MTLHAASLARTVRRADPDRFLTALFAPPAARETLFTLYAFNHELARAREVAREPMLALIRLQWWREVVEGQDKRHEVASPLHAALSRGELHAPDLLAMIDAREAEAAPIETLTDWRAYLVNGAGSVAVAAGRVLGVEDLPRLRELGAGYGAAGVLRSVGAWARAGRCLLPLDVLAAQGLSAEAVIGAPDAEPVRQTTMALATLAREFLGKPAAWPHGVAAALPAVLARRDLRRGPPTGRRALGDRLAVTAAALRGRA